MVSGAVGRIENNQRLLAIFKKHKNRSFFACTVVHGAKNLQTL